jgi:alanine transaminase
MIGECGRRGGYFECTNIERDVREQLYKMASISLCPAVQGQIMVDLMVKPPRQGDASYPLYQQEMMGIYGMFLIYIYIYIYKYIHFLESLKSRALKLAAAFNRMEGVTCEDAEGAMYLFPRVRLPPKAIEG